MLQAARAQGVALSPMALANMSGNTIIPDRLIVAARHTDVCLSYDNSALVTDHLLRKSERCDLFCTTMHKRIIYAREYPFHSQCILYFFTSCMK